MTQASSSPSPSRPSRVAALHRRGDVWRLVVIEGGESARLIDAMTLTADLGPAISAAQREHGFGTLVRVAPGRGTIARAASVPAAGPDETASALSLLAEAQLPGSLPAHRRGAGLIADGGSNGTRAVLLTGWDGPADPPGAILRRVPERWTTEIAALAVLRGGRSPWATCADPATGAVSVLVTGPDRTAARVLVEDASTPARFRQAAARALAEACNAVGAVAPARESAGLGLDPRAAAHLRAHVAGIPESDEWFEDYGVALGAALTAGAADPLTRGLASMLEAAPTERDSVLARAVAWLAQPRNAWTAAAVCAAIVLLAPLAFAAARLAVLEAKSAGLSDRTRQRADDRIRDALYQQLEASRWPMTKLLADVSAAAPVGVVANVILLSPEQGLSIQGTAQDPGQVNTFQANLNATRLFTGVKVGRVAASSSGVEFDLSAAVSNPHGAVPGAEDFAAKPLAARLYGEGASNTSAPTSAPIAERVPSRGTPRAGPERTERERSGGDDDRESRRPSPSKPTEVPPPLTDEQIKAMDRPSAMKEMTSRRTYPQHNPTTDAATKTRLAEEVRRLQEHMRSLNTPAPGGGG